MWQINIVENRIKLKVPTLPSTNILHYIYIVFRAEIENLLDNSKLLLEFRSGEEIKDHCDRLNQTDVYQAAILSNVFSGQKVSCNSILVLIIQLFD